MSSGSLAHKPHSKRIALPRIQMRPVVDVDARDRFDVQRRQRQRDERGDAVARVQVDRVAQRLADLEHVADEHAAAAGNRVVLLAALAHDAGDVLRDARGVAVARVGDLLERGRVDVEHLDVAEDLVLERDRRVVELPSALRHRAGAARARDACRADAARRSEGDAHERTAIPPRSNGVERTIVVLRARHARHAP